MDRKYGPVVVLGLCLTERGFIRTQPYFFDAQKPSIERALSPQRWRTSSDFFLIVDRCTVDASRGGGSTT